MLPKKSHRCPRRFIVTQPSMPKLRQSCPSELSRRLKLEIRKTREFVNVAQKFPSLLKAFYRCPTIVAQVLSELPIRVVQTIFETRIWKNTWNRQCCPENRIVGQRFLKENSTRNLFTTAVGSPEHFSGNGRIVAAAGNELGYVLHS